MKVRLYLSIFMGLFFGIAGYWVLVYLGFSEALIYSILAGILFALLLFIFLLLEEKYMNKKYTEVEKFISSPVLLKANGNFDLGNTVKNGNIYFCEESIVFISLDSKPYAVEEVHVSNIEKFEYDSVTKINIYTKDYRLFKIMTGDVPKIIDALMSRGWI